MKIACIAPSQIPATTAHSIQVMKVCQALAQAGHAVQLWVPAQAAARGPLPVTGVSWKDLAAWYGLTTPFSVHWLKADLRWKRYDLAWRAVGEALASGADLVYTWMPQAAVLSLMRGVPTILEVHDRPTGKIGPGLLGLFLRLKGRKRLALITQALRRVLEVQYRLRIPEEQAAIAPNGVDLARYRGLPGPAEARARLGLAEGLTAVYTGHFYQGRGMDVLAALAEAYPEVRFVWVGGTPAAVAEWQERLAERGLQNVQLTGFVENQRLALYQAAGEILLMPYERVIAGSGGGNSADICSPMKMFEYMAAGRAILTSDLPVIREVLDEDSAVFAPPEDAPAWVDAFGALAGDAEKMAALGEQASQRAGRYTWEARTDTVLRGFEQ